MSMDALDLGHGGEAFHIEEELERLVTDDLGELFVGVPQQACCQGASDCGDGQSSVAASSGGEVLEPASKPAAHALVPFRRGSTESFSGEGCGETLDVAQGTDNVMLRLQSMLDAAGIEPPARKLGTR